MRLQFNMGISTPLIFVVLFSSLTIFQQALAEDAFFNANCMSPFPESMRALQNMIIKKGYVVSRVQYVDKGLKVKGYETDLYRVVFFGKKDEILSIQKEFPALIPFIPLTITIFESGSLTSISSINPLSVTNLYNSKTITKMIKSWRDDLEDIFKQYQRCTY